MTGAYELLAGVTWEETKSGEWNAVVDDHVQAFIRPVDDHFEAVFKAGKDYDCIHHNPTVLKDYVSRVLSRIL